MSSEAETVRPPYQSLILSVIGAAFALFALYAFLSNQALENSGLRAQGTVIDLVAKDTTSNAAGYAPLIEWNDEAGRLHSFKGSVASNPPKYVVGQAVTVLYSPADPSNARIDAPGEAMLLPFLFGGMGLVFLLLGVGPVVTHLKRRLAGT